MIAVLLASVPPAVSLVTPPLTLVILLLSTGVFRLRIFPSHQPFSCCEESLGRRGSSRGRSWRR